MEPLPIMLCESHPTAIDVFVGHCYLGAALPAVSVLLVLAMLEPRLLIFFHGSFSAIVDYVTRLVPAFSSSSCDDREVM